MSDTGELLAALVKLRKAERLEARIEALMECRNLVNVHWGHDFVRVMNEKIELAQREFETEEWVKHRCAARKTP